ncbi:hypothetical protein QX204_17735 [Nocardia sp. PE-7]|uniref:hypothetical protein n=1 Tax=Nocardia sp. PE-7 TaxID=3058426 RepID=UPI00265A5380|nr:hypothetical protein [Nocardia sp. PE-7]WKG06960.1 hypothetical protein QX204_17735 [Nocardia sp. PE-7]
MGPDEGRFDAVERLRRKWEEAKAKAEEDGSGAAGGSSNVVRLPRMPRRGREKVDQARPRPWPAEEVDDPAPTRPVTRAELQGETGAWLFHGAALSAPQADEHPEHEGKVIDLGASRRKRTGADSSPGRARPRAMPRRIGSADTPGGEADTAPTDRPER